MKKIFPFIFIFAIVFLFFWQFAIKGLLPVPSDTIVGLYHPFRDLYAKNYPNGIPFKNFLITDPVRQQYPWRELAISFEKSLKLPLWNPYSFSGMPLLGNLQSAAFYPLNLLLMILPFSLGWSIYVFLAPLLAGAFLFLYLSNLKLNKLASLLGAIVFSFSGFFIVWLEWGTIVHVALWLPLILLSIDKLFLTKSKLWRLIYIFSLLFSFFAGYLQVFFYTVVFSLVYFVVRWFQYGKDKKILFNYLILNILVSVFSLIQLIPTLQLILLSARNIDQASFTNPGWFIPWQHLIQFVAPDYFGNPATLNYWGTWNYGELVGYVGIVPLIFALYAAFFRKDKKTFFFGTFFFLSLLLALPTFIAMMPYALEIPFFSSSQPTRLLFLTDFTLAVLAAFGMDYFIRAKKKSNVLYPVVFLTIILISLWIFIPKENITVVKNNLILPTIIFSCSLLLIFVLIFFKNKFIHSVLLLMIVLTTFDLLRFGWKFTPFTPREYLFPSTQVITFLQENLGNNRFMATDSRILPPNFSIVYRIQSVGGYDPLYLLRYGEIMAASERGSANIIPPFGFNRIITPQNHNSRVIDLLGVKYVLSLSPLNSDNLIKVFQEGQTIIYQNNKFLPRTFFVTNTVISNNKEESIRLFFDQSVDLFKTAIVEDAEIQETNWSLGKSEIKEYSENKIVINTENTGEGFLLLTDVYYPTWKVKVDGNQAKIYLTDYTFRGVIVPSGKHRVEFHNSLF